MPRLLRQVLRFSLMAFALGTAAILRAEFFGFGLPKDAPVNVVVDFTEEGRKIAPPTAERPAFYFPLVAGYRERGALVAGEKSPANDPVSRLFAKALAAQHYYVVGPGTAAPTLLLVFHWGYINPQIDTFFEVQYFWNEREMLGMVAGNTLGNLPPFGSVRDEVLSAIRENRYFATLSAYDLESAKQGNRKLLWRAKMSTPSSRVNLADVLPAMIVAGGPHFGRETKLPASVKAPITREGRVEIGPLIVVPDEPAGSNGRQPTKK